MSSAFPDRLPAFSDLPPGLGAGLLGALLGDALGVPHEFKPAALLPPSDSIQLVMPVTYRKTYAQLPYGLWSDDGSQLLCLWASLSAGAGDFDAEDFGRRLLAWRHEAYLQAGGQVFDCGLQTDAALSRLAQDPTAPLQAGATGERSNGNGSLMRCLPAVACALYWGRPLPEALQVAMVQSGLTHAHPVAQISCAAYCLLAHQVGVSGPPERWRAAAFAAIAQLPRLLPLDGAQRAALARLQQFGEQELPTGGGFVLDAFWSAIWALDLGRDYLPAVRAAISLGNDTDTTACITGGLAGLAYGLASVPAPWWADWMVPAEAQRLLRPLLRV